MILVDHAPVLRAAPGAIGLPRRTPRWSSSSLARCIWVEKALGRQMVEGVVATPVGDRSFVMFSGPRWLEEVMEMCGVLIFIAALVRYYRRATSARVRCTVAGLPSRSPMKWKSIALCIICLWSVPIGAQWINYPTTGVPKGRDGRPNLTAPAPRTGGKPDLSGVWQTRIVPGAEPTTEPVAGSSSFLLQNSPTLPHA